MKYIHENFTGYITKESCNLVLQGDCLSGFEFILFLLIIYIVGIIIGFIIYSLFCKVKCDTLDKKLTNENNIIDKIYDLIDEYYNEKVDQKDFIVTLDNLEEDFEGYSDEECNYFFNEYMKQRREKKKKKFLNTRK